MGVNFRRVWELHRNASWLAQTGLCRGHTITEADMQGDLPHRASPGKTRGAYCRPWVRWDLPCRLAYVGRGEFQVDPECAEEEEDL